MARVNIPVQTLSGRTKLDIGASGTETAGDATNENYFVNDGHTFLMIRNSGVTTRTVEVVIQQTIDGVTPAVKSYSITTGLQTLVGPFPPGVYNTGGQVYVNCDHAEVKYQAISLGS